MAEPSCFQVEKVIDLSETSAGHSSSIACVGHSILTSLSGNFSPHIGSRRSVNFGFWTTGSVYMLMEPFMKASNFD